MPDFSIRFTGDRSRLKSAIDANINDLNRMAAAAKAASQAMAAGPGTGGRGGGTGAVSTAAARYQQMQMVGLDKLRMAAVKYGDALKRAEDAGRVAADRRITRGMVGLDQLRARAVKYGDSLRKAESVAARDAESRMTRSMVGLDKLRANAIKYGDGLRKAADTAAESHENLGEKGEKSLLKITAAAAGTIGVMHALAGAASAVGDAVEKAAAKSRELAAGFGDQRDQLRELAGVMGKQANNQFTLDFAKFNAKTGLKANESLAFQTSMMNSGAQYEGKTISKPEFAQYREQTGSLAAAMGINPENVGDLAGKTLGFRDFRKFGGQASESALGELHQNLSILQRGSGGNATLASQAARITSRLLSDDETKGIFKSSKEAAIAESVVAEAAPDEADTAVRSAVRGLRGFGRKDPQSKLLRRAGITEGTGFLDSIKKLAPAVEAERARSKPGTKTQDVLAKYFKDERTKNALSVFLNKGIGGGVIADREQYAADLERGPGGPDAARGASALGVIGRFQKSEAGQSRKADATVKLAEMERGSETSKIDILRKQALAELINERSIDTTETNVAGYIAEKASFGSIPDAHQERINTRAADIAARRAKKAGLTGFWNTRHGITANPFEAGYEKSINRVLGEIEGKGFDPLTGEPVAPAGGAPPAPPGVGPQANLDRMKAGGAFGGMGLRGAIASMAVASMPSALDDDAWRRSSASNLSDRAMHGGPIVNAVGVGRDGVGRDGGGELVGGSGAGGTVGPEILAELRQLNALMKTVVGARPSGPAPNAAPGPLPNPRMPRPGGAGR